MPNQLPLCRPNHGSIPVGRAWSALGGVVLPGRVIVPFLVAFLDLLQRPSRILCGVVGSKPVVIWTPILAFDYMVLHAKPIFTVAHSCFLHVFVYANINWRYLDF